MTSELGVPGVVGSTEIGRGGFGTVYRGVEAELGRTVAVKVLPAGLQTRDRDRFDRERRAMGSLSGHPNIVTVHRTGFTDGGQPYIVMEYLEQGSMEDRLRRDGPLPWSEAVAIGVALAGAVQAAHDAGILHRDIKPGNVLMTPWGEPKLADFGIARLEGAPETSSSVVTASVAHAGPEIIDGIRPSEASDLYSLGSTIYTLIAGRPPFHDPDDQSIVPMLARIARDPLPPLGGAPPALHSVLARAMAKAPAERHPSAAVFARELSGVAAAGPVAGVPVADGPNGDTALVGGPGWPDPVGPADGGTNGSVDEPATGPTAPPVDRRSRLVAVVALALTVLVVAGTVAVSVLGGDDGDDGGDGAALPEVTDDDYDGYETRFDRSGAIRVAVPRAWSDVEPGEATGPATFRAALDADAVLGRGQPGVIITVEPERLIGADDALDQVVDPTGCRDRGRGDYDGGALVGRFHHLDECGSDGDQLWFVAAGPQDETFTVMVVLQAADPRDETAARRLLDNLIVDARAVPGA